jgi:hypothetical protein
VTLTFKKVLVWLLVFWLPSPPLAAQLFKREHVPNESSSSASASTCGLDNNLSGLWRKLSSPKDLQDIAITTGVCKAIGNTLPIKLDASDAYPAVADSGLPGGPFHGQALDLTADNLFDPLPPATGWCR